MFTLQPKVQPLIPDLVRSLRQWCNWCNLFLTGAIGAILPTFSQLIKTCIAFANGVGGKIIIGVEDKTREIIGIN